MQEEELNGAKEKILQVPALAIGWNEQEQRVQLTFDPAHFKTWEFILGILEMAKNEATARRQLVLMQNMQQAQIDSALRQRVMSGR